MFKAHRKSFGIDEVGISTWHHEWSTHAARCIWHIQHLIRITRSSPAAAAPESEVHTLTSSRRNLRQLALLMPWAAEGSLHLHLQADDDEEHTTRERAARAGAGHIC